MGNKQTKGQGNTKGNKRVQKRVAFQESVLDITGKPVNTEPKLGQSSIASQPRLKNIFAAPVKIIEDYVFPVNEKSDEDKEFIRGAVEDNFIFSGVEGAALANLLNAFELREAEDGETIITEGEVGDFFYILQEGKVSFSVQGSKVGSAEKGSSFGDLALLYDCPRAATCTAIGACKLWRVEQNAFRQILANSTLTKDRAILDTLKKVPFLKDLEIEYLNKMANNVVTKTYKQGETIIKKGSLGLEFFVIKTGEVSVEDIEVGGRKYDDQVLGPGDYFGERAIVKEEPRAANIIATADVVALTLSRENFLAAVGPLQSLIDRAADLRVLVSISTQ